MVIIRRKSLIKRFSGDGILGATGNMISNMTEEKDSDSGLTKVVKQNPATKLVGAAGSVLQGISDFTE